MQVPRAFHTATLLANGQVLVAGGFNFSRTETSAELFDPRTGTWSTTGSMHVARQGHTATMLPTGQVFVVGGDTGTTSEFYDPSTGQWTLAAPTAMPHRSGHTASLLADGQVLVAGGVDASGQPTKAAEVYDPDIGQWSPVGSMVVAHFAHAAAALPDGRVLVAAGSDTDTHTTAAAEIYDPVTSRWMAIPALASPRYAPSATRLATGGVVVAGGLPNGGSAEVFDPTSGRWTATGSLPDAHVDHSATLLPDGTLLVAAGCDNTSQCNQALSTTASYDPSTRAWTPGASLNRARRDHTSTLLPEGRILVTGGVVPDGGGSFTTSAELYDPLPGKWTYTGSLTTARFSHTATLLLDGEVLVAGGSIDGANTPTSSAETYAGDGTWHATGAMQIARVDHAAALLPSGVVLVAGGDRQFGLSAELYDPTTRTWRRTADMSAQRFYGLSLTPLADGRVLATGLCRDSGAQLSAELYTYDPVARTGGWQATGSMSMPRCNHSATLLTSGQVVVAGGSDGQQNALASVEVYDPRTGAWIRTAPLAQPCYFPLANLLPTGQVLLVCEGEAQVFTWDPTSSTGRWDSTGSLNATRTLYGATVTLRDGRVVFTGGQDGADATTRSLRYDPGTGTWTVAGQLNTVRQLHSATLLPSGRLLVAGGLGTFATDVQASAELYDTGLGYQAAWQPVVASIAPLAVGGALGIQGNLFRGVSEAASGSTQNGTSTAYPLVQLQRIDNGQSLFLVVDPFAGWTDTTFTSLPLAGLVPGPALLTVHVNGIPGNAVPVVVQPSTISR